MLHGRRATGMFGADPGHGESRSLWRELARAALSMSRAEPDNSAQDPGALATAINTHPEDVPYEAALFQALNDLIGALRNGGREADEIRKGISHVIASLETDKLARIIAGGPEPGARRELVREGSEVVEPASLLALVVAGGRVARQPVPRRLVQLLAKLAAGTYGDVGVAALREQIRGMAAGWWITEQRTASPNGEPASRPRREPRPATALRTEPDRLVRLSLASGGVGLAVWEPVALMIEHGEMSKLLELVREAPVGSRSARAIADHLATPARLAALLEADPVDFGLVDILLETLGGSAAEVLLDALMEAGSRTTRRGIFDRLVRLGSPVAALAAQRLEDERWFVQRNMLALLRELGSLPAGVSMQDFIRHPDVRVRREAIQLLCSLPDHLDRAIPIALRDRSWEIVRAGLLAARNGSEQDWGAAVARGMTEREFPPELHVPAIRVLSGSRSEEALEILLRFATDGRTFLGRPRLAPKSPELLLSVAGLAQRWSRHPRARAVLRQARRSADAAVRTSAMGRTSERRGAQS